MNTMNTSASTTGSSPRLGPDVIVLDGGMGDELRRKFPVGCHREKCATFMLATFSGPLFLSLMLLNCTRFALPNRDSSSPDIAQEQ